MNKHILIAMDKESFTKDELKKNKDSATATADAAAAAYATTAAAAAAAYATTDADDVADDVDYWIDMYFKKTGENKQDYIDEIKRLKGSVVMDIWKDAPESATHYDIEAECFCKNDGYWATGSRARYVQDNTQIQWGDEDRYTPRPMFIDCKVNNEPQPALTYTQEMADNGVLPSVGMYVEAYKDRVVEIMLPFDPTRFTVGKCKDGEYALYSIGELKPLTPPITLVHGKAYQFDIRPQYGNTNGIQGIYSEKLRVFQSSGNGFHEETVENIQPLTVEVK